MQYNYNDLAGALQCHDSAQRLRDAAPNVLLPSLGVPILANTDDAFFAHIAGWETDYATVRNPLPEATVLTAAGQPFGQVAEALVTIGEGAF